MPTVGFIGSGRFLDEIGYDAVDAGPLGPYGPPSAPDSDQDR
jgi:hypothetical protein